MNGRTEGEGGGIRGNREHRTHGCHGNQGMQGTETLKSSIVYYPNNANIYKNVLKRLLNVVR